jgi:hypothetical protein
MGYFKDTPKARHQSGLFKGFTTRQNVDSGPQKSALHKEQPSEEVEAWREDEARFGLKPILRRMWSPIRERPRAEVDARYEWLWLYVVVHPRTGRMFWLALPRLDSNCVQLIEK